jgi:hypothetical protein
MIDLKSRRALATAEIPLVNSDGSPMTLEDGSVATVTVQGPGTKRWKRADAEMNRRKMVRVEKAGGKLSAAVEEADEDSVYFLTEITDAFTGIDYRQDDGQPFPEKKAMFHAIYSDDELGFIADHVFKKARDWASFTRGSQSN